MTEMQTIEGGWKDVFSLEGTTFKKVLLYPNFSKQVIILNCFREKEELSNKFVSAKLQIKDSETELKQTQSKLSESSESCTNLKNLLEATQQVKGHLLMTSLR